VKRYARGEVVGAAIALSIMVPAVTAAQGAGSGVVAVTISGTVPVPVGQLVDNRNVGVGGIGGLRYAPAASSPFAIRPEVAGLLPSSLRQAVRDRNRRRKMPSLLCLDRSSLTVPTGAIRP
jgi:hypothetical protein